MGLGGLVTKFGSDTSGFDAGVKRVKTGLGGIAASATSILNPMTAGFVALGAAAAAAGLSIAGVVGRIGDLAGIADKAAQTGLSGAFLQQLGYAADQSGVSVETLQGGIKKLTIAIGQVKAETDSGADKFRELGISVTELKALTPEQQFLRVAEQIGKIPDAAGRAAAAVKVFGKSGVDMTTLFSGGLNDINKLMAEAAELGIGIDEEGLAKIAAADDSIQRLKATFGALIDQVAVGLAPTFEAVANAVTSVIPPVTKLFAQFNQLDDKFQFTADLLSAAFDVAIQTIKEKWSEMLSGLASSAADAAMKIATFPAAIARGAAEGIGLIGPAQRKPDSGGLAGAQGRLNDVLARLQAGGAAPAAAVGAGVGSGPLVPLPDLGKGAGKGSIGGLLGPAFRGALGLGKDALKGAVGIGKGIAGFVQDIFDDKPAKGRQPEFASVMMRGSVDAMRTINSAGRSSPAVQVAQQQLGVQKQGNKLLKLVADNSKPMFAPEFA